MASGVTRRGTRASNGVVEALDVTIHGHCSKEARRVKKDVGADTGLEYGVVEALAELVPGHGGEDEAPRLLDVRRVLHHLQTSRMSSLQQHRQLVSNTPATPRCAASALSPEGAGGGEGGEGGQTGRQKDRQAGKGGWEDERGEGAGRQAGRERKGGRERGKGREGKRRGELEKESGSGRERGGRRQAPPRSFTAQFHRCRAVQYLGKVSGWGLFMHNRHSLPSAIAMLVCRLPSRDGATVGADAAGQTRSCSREIYGLGCA